MRTFANKLAKIEGLNLPDESAERVVRRVEAARTARFLLHKAEQSARSEKTRSNLNGILLGFKISNILSNVKDNKGLSKKLMGANDEDTEKQNQAIRKNLSRMQADFLVKISEIYSADFDYESQKIPAWFDEKRFGRARIMDARETDASVREAITNYESRMRKLEEKQNPEKQMLINRFSRKISELLFG